MKEPMGSYRQEDGFVGSLERVAGLLGSGDAGQQNGDFVKLAVEHEIALVLSQLARLRARRAESRKRLAAVECDIGTELLQMESIKWWYLDSREERWRDRQQLKARLAATESERARGEARFDQEFRSLEDRLLVLVHRHGALGGVQNGNGH